MTSTVRRLASTLLALLLGASAARAQVLRVIAMPPAESDPTTGTHQGRMVDESLLADWRKLRDRARAEGATIIALEITTPGGMLQVAQVFVNDLRHLRAEGIRTVAYVPDHATSAGAIIAFGCKELIMAPRAQIGNVIPLKMDVRGFERAEEKVVSEVVGLMKGLAREGGFPEVLLEAMVRPEMEVLQVYQDGRPVSLMTRDELMRQWPDELPRGVRTSTLVNSGVALKLFGDDAAVLGIARQALSRDELPGLLGLGQRALEDGELLMLPGPPRFGPFGHLLGLIDWSSIFLVLGVVFLIVEFKTPGLGLPGVLALLSFIAYFALRAGDGGYALMSFGLLLLGILLIVVEVLLIPGIGVAGISGVLLVIVAIYSATVDFGGDGFFERMIPDNESEVQQVQGFALYFLASLVIGFTGAVFVAQRLHKVPFLGRAFLAPPSSTAADAALRRPLGPSGPTGHVTLRVGAQGLADTDLRPAGKASFTQGVVDVVSQGDWIPRGTPLTVVLIEGNRVVVARAEGAAP